MAIHFYLKKPNPSTGESLIFLQSKFNGQRLVFSFDEKVKPNHWNKKTERIHHRYEDDYTNLNTMLDNIEKACKDKLREYKASGIIPTPKMLSDYLAERFKQIATPKATGKNLFNLIDEFISGEILIDKGKNRGQNKTDGTLRHYNVVKGHLLAFQDKYKYPVDFHTINRDFFNKYVNYLAKEATLPRKGGKVYTQIGLSQNTIQKNIQTLKVFLNYALEEGLTDNKEFTKGWFSVSGEESESIALTRAEIKRLYDVDLSEDKTLEQVRDLFVLGCNVGLRISDYKNIKPHNIIEEDGERLIKIKTQKNKKTVIIPCNQQVVEILDKYKKGLPRPVADAVFNRYIKEASKKAGLKAKGRLQNEENKELWECVSSHTARRSFCTNLYKEGVPSVVIMQISGHKTETNFLKYIKMSGQDAVDTLKQHYKKTKEGLRVAS